MSSAENTISNERAKGQRSASCKKECIQRNLSETKFAVKTDSQKFSFKNYVKTQIQKENQMNEKLDKNKDKPQYYDYVQQLIDLKLQIQKTSFIDLYKKKYLNSQQEKINDKKGVKISTKTQEIINQLNTSQSIHSLNKKVQNHIDQINQQNQQINQKLEVQQKSQFISDQFHSTTNHNNLLAKDLLQRQNSNYSVFIHNSINTQLLATESVQKINYDELKQYQSLNRQNQPEILKKEEGNADFEEQLIKIQKQPENQEIKKKLISSRQKIQTQNTIEDDESCSSSGEEFDLDLLPKSRLIFQINKNSQSNYQSAPNQSRQSVDLNYNHISQKCKQATGVEEECQQNNSNEQSISSKLKQIVAKRKFASENIQSQHIKNLHKLMPHAFEKVEKNQQRVTKSPIKSQKSQILYEEIKALNSQESTNQNFPISSEETDIDLHEANTQESTKQLFQNKFFSTPNTKQQLKVDQNTEKCAEKAKFIVKGRPQKFLKQVRSQSVNNNKFQNQNNQSESKIQYPMINILLCSTKNANCSDVKNNLSFTQATFACQEKTLQPSSLNNLSNQFSSKNSNDPSPTSNSNIEAQKTLSKESSSEAIHTKKKQTIKLGHIKHLLMQNPAKNQKEKFINYHLVLKENNQKECLPQKYISNQFRNRRSTTQLKSYLLDNTSKEALENNQKNINCSLNNPIIVQSLQSSSFKNFNQNLKQNQQYFSENPQVQQTQLLCQKKNNLKQVNFSNILDISSIENEVLVQKIAQ
ncbi:hypothetical protein TTHERM_00320320 (macronuclear) [Tetrahymena thermophila SB210]|uniref:Uncharacterized protein n=1 Tax=Tetrahymena thermophila (strain SB210) TaxID=312017 RepID=Q237Q5_TETTS|nr:hypothetical protein TTHERM_00320320 [Tetrahymena thermophila SB210]EAR92686.1 hypothetical protein TTHERM_00320320 [Tetrahymena thermophila SB210]|eukprot:XP_001012931.1 hypothetical protein TTHERM_00320320 [Tetrahymena thermophila SB210]